MEKRNNIENPKVYFTKILEPKSLIDVYNALDLPLNGKVAVKLHSG